METDVAKKACKCEETIVQQSEAKRLRRKAQSQEDRLHLRSMEGTVTPVLAYPIQPYSRLYQSHQSRAQLHSFLKLTNAYYYCGFFNLPYEL